MILLRCVWQSEALVRVFGAWVASGNIPDMDGPGPGGIGIFVVEIDHIGAMWFSFGPNSTLHCARLRPQHRSEICQVLPGLGQRGRSRPGIGWIRAMPIDSDPMFAKFGSLS